MNKFILRRLLQVAWRSDAFWLFATLIAVQAFLLTGLLLTDFGNEVFVASWAREPFTKRDFEFTHGILFLCWICFWLGYVVLPKKK